MKITLTKQETDALIKYALVEQHSDLLKHAGFGYMAEGDFDIEIASYEKDDYLTITKHVKPVEKEEVKK